MVGVPRRPQPKGLLAQEPKSLAQWWRDDSLFNRMFVQPAMSGLLAVEDAYQGRVPMWEQDPATGEFRTSQQAIERGMDTAGLMTLGAGAVPAQGAELGMGIRRLPSGEAEMGWVTRDVDRGAASAPQISKAQQRAMNIATDTDAYETVEVPIRSLIATQTKVNADFADAAKKRQSEGGKYELPAVFRVNGKLVLRDGHHRVAAAADTDKQTVKVRLFDVDALMGSTPDPRQMSLTY